MKHVSVSGRPSQEKPTSRLCRRSEDPFAIDTCFNLQIEKGKLKYNRSRARLYHPTIAQGSSMRRISAGALRFTEPPGRGSLRADHLS